MREQRGRNEKDEALEEQQTTAEAAEATEAEAVQAEEIPDAVDETAEKSRSWNSRLRIIWTNIKEHWRNLITSASVQ